MQRLNFLAVTHRSWSEAEVFIEEQKVCQEAFLAVLKIRRAKEQTF